MARQRNKTSSGSARKSAASGLIVLALLFSISMAFLESAVVVYIREIYYPEGFVFPLKLMAGHIVITELLREAATIIMLIVMGIVLGRNGSERFAFFLFCFAIWDIFYYIFLYLLIGWPQNLLTWDVLFMIPVTWTGPVIAPVLNSLTMIILALLMIPYSAAGKALRPGVWEWLLLIFGSAAILYSYTQEYTRFMMNSFSIRELLSGLHEDEILLKATAFIPQSFQWQFFGGGQLLLFIALVLLYRKK